MPGFLADKASFLNLDASEMSECCAMKLFDVFFIGGLVSVALIVGRSPTAATAGLRAK